MLTRLKRVLSSVLIRIVSFRESYRLFGYKKTRFFFIFLKSFNFSCLIIGLGIGIWIVLLVIGRLILIVPISTVEAVGHFLKIFKNLYNF